MNEKEGKDGQARVAYPDSVFIHLEQFEKHLHKHICMKL